MGTWGPALYSDDSARDLRSRFVDLLGETQSAARTRRQLYEEFAEAFRDTDDGPILHLALADLMWRYGVPERGVLSRAIRIIDSGVALRRWEENRALITKRRRVLAALKKQLLSKPPLPKKVKPPFRDVCDWERGEIIMYRARNGRTHLLRVVGLYNDPSGGWLPASWHSPVVEVLDWAGRDTPNQEVLDALPVLKTQDGRSMHVLIRLSNRDCLLRSLTRTGLRSTPRSQLTAADSPNRTLGSMYARWLDRDLKTFLKT